MTNDYLRADSMIESIISRNHINELLESIYNGKRPASYRLDFQLWLLLVLEIWMRKYA
jgi:hypothetical protein